MPCATFVAARWASVPGSATATIVGAYDPPSTTYEFATDTVNLAWFDTADSLDGPATVLRLVLDVSEVDGADVSEGFGSVYFSTTGPQMQSDIFVADLSAAATSQLGGPTLKTLGGEFYVRGE